LVTVDPFYGQQQKTTTRFGFASKTAKRIRNPELARIAAGCRPGQPRLFQSVVRRFFTKRGGTHEHHGGGELD